MQSYKPGDFYNRTPLLNLGWPAPCGVVIETEIQERNFAKYRLVYFERSTNANLDCDIFRVSEGPDLWLGCIVWDKDFELPYTFFDLIRIENPKDCKFKTQWDGINYLIEISEKELEAHFNQLFATS